MKMESEIFAIAAKAAADAAIEAVLAEAENEFEYAAILAKAKQWSTSRTKEWADAWVSAWDTAIEAERQE